MQNHVWLFAPRPRGRTVLAALAACLLALPGVGGRAFAQDAPAPAAPPAAVEPAPLRVGANLNISPKRLTFDRSGRSATIYIFNQGSETATFDIHMVDRVMAPSGQITAIADVTDPALKEIAARVKSAQPMLIATPRRATLAPGKGQTIRVRVTPGAENTVAGGEYRTHLTVTTIPPRDLGLTAEQAASTRPDELTFLVHSVFGISVPVIVRLGAPDVRGAIENAHITYADISPDGVAPKVRTAVLNLDVARLGPNSLFGNLEVRAAKEKEPMGMARGVGVYTEIDKRALQIPLRRLPAAGERLDITFSDDDTSPGRVIAQSAFTAP